MPTIDAATANRAHAEQHFPARIDPRRLSRSAWRSGRRGRVDRFHAGAAFPVTIARTATFDRHFAATRGVKVVDDGGHVADLRIQAQDVDAGALLRFLQAKTGA